VVDISRFKEVVFDIEVPIDALRPLIDVARTFLENLSWEDIRKLGLGDKDFEMLTSFRAARGALLESADGWV